MKSLKNRFILTCVFLLFPLLSASGVQEQPEDNENFENKDTFMDLSEALRSKQYVHRAILSTVVKDTNRLQPGKFYINHLTGFGAVWQKTGAVTKYTSGIQSLSVGYVTNKGHGYELGVDFSAVSNLFVGYRYFIRPANFLLWGFAGAGFGRELEHVGFGDGPKETASYNGRRELAFISLGFLIPIIDVSLKAETRFIFYGLDRIILNTGLGVIFFI
jgi:hypothetical protein